ncbi:MAG: hypothetical protein KC423_01435 [Anaerolineales bacterium]|nr:hypothetical protein [Anaerolineales bacterium]MCA9962866.1 hypothetical protein [Anaerolineales bacterium]
MENADRRDNNSQIADSQPSGSSAASLPAITLPKGGGAIRGMGEKFAANPVTGAGSLTVPIATSPGRSGFGPQLSLAYNSGAGNGPFGLGWQLSLPSISRKTDKGLPRYQDAVESDVFILSGAEDLVPLLENIGGQWERHEETRSLDGIVYHIQRYRPRIEGLFARIERWANLQTGEMHWRSITRDNVTTLYGKTAESRIADPEDPTRIFSWLICQSYDDKGNAIIYEYVAENSAAVDTSQSHERNRSEQSRSANRYLKRIKYGNRTPNRDAHCQATDPAQLSDWMFTVLLDYGEEHYKVFPQNKEKVAEGQHAHIQASIAGNADWVLRQDPFSSYRAGFEVRTYRLCQRVMMFHHFPNELGVENCLVRSTEFLYDESPIASFINNVIQSGYVHEENGRYLKKSLPPLELRYSQVEIDETIHEVDSTSLENLPYGLDGRNYQWVDLDGEGLSGILTEQGNAWFYKPNRGNGRFGPLQTVARKPSLAALGQGQQQFLDLAGDGQLDLVAFDSPTPGFYERTADRDWEVFRPFTALPMVNWRDPNLRFVDLTGDGHADILLTEDRVINWYPSLGEDGFGQVERTYQALDEERGPNLVFADADQSIYLADLSGDGLTDLVRIRNGEVCYWPNLGYGRFGAKVTMDNAPWFDTPGLFDQRRLHLADIDGSGTTDLIYIGSDGVTLYFNQSGNRWSDPRPLPIFPHSDNLSSVTVVDLLGNGTACLVWSTPLPAHNGRVMRYVDLMGGQKPHLLIEVHNNLGAETHVQYVASTHFYLADQAAGKPWITRLPFPVHVVTQVETFDRISQNRFISRYAYHHGYFDGEEREFRGFGLVEQWDSDQSSAYGEATNIDATSFMPPIHTKSWFHTGFYRDRTRISRLFAGEYYREPGLSDEAFAAMLLPDTQLPVGLAIAEEREAARALKGQMLRQEVYTLDDSPQTEHPYSVVERSYRLKVLQPREGNRHAVFYVCACNSVDYHYERNPHDPRISHQMSLEVDEFGNVLKALAIGYGRRAKNSPLTGKDVAKQEQLLMTYTETAVTNAVDELDSYRTPLPWEVRTYELTGYSLPDGAEQFHIQSFVADDFALVQTAVPISYETVPTPALKQKRLIEHGRTRFRVHDLSGPLPFGQIDALALPYEQYKLAFTPGLLDLYTEKIVRADLEKILAKEGRYVVLDGDGQWWIPSGQIFYSPELDDAPDAELAHARQHFFLPHRFEDVFGETAVVHYDAYDLLVQKTIDPLNNQVQVTSNYRVLQPQQMIDPNGNRSAVLFDALGMVAGQAIMGKAGQQAGDHLEAFKPELTLADIRQFLSNPQDSAAALLGNATTRNIYDLFAFIDGQQPVYSATLTREQHVSDLAEGEGCPIQIAFTYADGFGREVQTKVQAEPGLAPEREHNSNNPTRPGRLKRDPESGELILSESDVRWVGNGRTVYNNKGKPVKQYEPFFSTNHLFETEAEMVETGVTPILFYDPLERVVATLHPNRTYEKVVFDPWQQTTWDVNDTILQTNPQDDPDVGSFFQRLPPEEYLPSWYAQRQDGALGKQEQSAAEKTAVHANTPTVTYLDSLGRPFLAVADNGVDENGRFQRYQTRTEQDLEGQTLTVIDALGRTVMDYRLHPANDDEAIGWLPGYAVSGNQLYQKSMEAGACWLLPDVGGKPIRTWDDRGFQRRMTYDALQRPLNIFVQPQDEAEFLAEKTVYGESKPHPEATNHRSQVWQVYDAAGVVTSEAYDFKGNLLTGTRQFLRDYRGQVDWTADPDLEDEQFSSQTRYDALNRPIALTTPDNSVIRPRFNEANLLEQVEANLRGADEATIFVSNINYNAKGQREAVVYGNGVDTTYTYDPDTFRLTRLHTQRGEQPLQDLRYTYDPVGNISHIADTAQQTIFFKNEVVSPHNDYAYDAIYRLIRANGREQIGQTGQPEASWRDEHRTNLIHPHDGQAMRRYREQYRYDEVDNILHLIHRAQDGNWTRDYAYEEPSLLQPDRQSNRLTYTQVGERQERYHHDEHGNMIAMPHLTQMTWNYQDQLRRVALNNGGTAYYLYDAAGQRVRKVIERPNGTRQKERLYLGGLESYREYNGNGEAVTLARETLHLMDDTQRIALVETCTEGEDNSPQQLIRFQLNNHLGSATLELDAQAQIISYEEYTPYGSTAYHASRSQTELPKRYRYTSKERDEESGFYYHGARYYAPWLGRWISADSAGLVDGSNLYQYVSGNPIRIYDSTGMEGEDSLVTGSYQSVAGDHVHQVASRTAQPGAKRTTAPQIKESLSVSTKSPSYLDKAGQKVESAINRAAWGKDYDKLPAGEAGKVRVTSSGVSTVGKTTAATPSTWFEDVKSYFKLREAGVQPDKAADLVNRSGAQLEAAGARPHRVPQPPRSAPMSVKVGQALSAETQTVSTAAKAVSTEQNLVKATVATAEAGRMAKAIQVGSNILKPLAPVARLASKAATPVSALLVGVQFATAETTEDYVDASISATSTALLASPHPVAKAGGAGLAAGQVIEKTLDVSDYASSAGMFVNESLQSAGANETFSLVAGGVATVAATPASIGVAAGHKAYKGAKWVASEAYERATSDEYTFVPWKSQLWSDIFD